MEYEENPIPDRLRHCPQGAAGWLREGRNAPPFPAAPVVTVAPAARNAWSAMYVLQSRMRDSVCFRQCAEELFDYIVETLLAFAEKVGW